VASLVLWFGLDDWVIDQIGREVKQMLMRNGALFHWQLYAKDELSLKIAFWVSQGSVLTF